MAEYQVLARRYRPQLFSDVLGQEAIVATLKNMMKMGRVAHAYLFCGSKGTGKTTLARLFAKALNCQNPTPDFEPCNVCSSCREITAGSSLDILEIDGASNRGIDDIRRINETVGYAAASGKYKIYIIDEVHMLTKEAFNALLKTLEEPPPAAKFFFATTEPHKVLPTILSRCQRFNLSRISPDVIAKKLRRITTELNIQADDDAIHMVASMADGGLRDAESLFDQVLAFHEGRITAEAVAEVLGVLPRDVFFRMDVAGQKGELAEAFEIANTVFSQGKDLLHFVEGLIEHFRNLLVVQVAGPNGTLLAVSDNDRKRYMESAALYSREQCMNLLDYLIEAQGRIRFAPSSRVALEAILLHIMRSHQRIPVEMLVRKLAELEQRIKEGGPSPAPAPVTAPSKPLSKQAFSAPQASPPPVEPPAMPRGVISEDPTPRLEDLPPKKATKAPATPPPPKENEPAGPKESNEDLLKRQSRYDTILHFAAVELQANMERKPLRR